MPGHVKSTLMGASLTVPITDGKLVLGEKQVSARVPNELFFFLQPALFAHGTRSTIHM